MNQNTFTSTRHWETFATLDEKEVASFFTEQCARLSIPISVANPTLADLQSAIDSHVSAHANLPLCDRVGAEVAAPGVQSGVSALQSALHKVIAQIQHNKDTSAASNPAPTPEPQQVNAERASERAGERPPSDPRPDAEPDAVAHSRAHMPRFSRPGAKFTQPAPTAEESARARGEQLAELLRERTGRSPLDDLPADRQTILFELLEEYPATLVHEMLSKPAPLGWGLETSPPSLKRYLKRHRDRIHREQLASAATQAATIAEDPSSSAAQFTEASQRVVQMRLFQRATNPNISAQEVYNLSRAIDRHRRTCLIERKLDRDESERTSQP